MPRMDLKFASRAAGLLIALAAAVLAQTSTPPSGADIATNGHLKALSTSGKAEGYGIFRQGFHAPFDGGGQQYYLSRSACPIAGGNDFTQVAPNAGAGCWRAAPAPAHGYDLRAAGLRAGDVSAYQAENAAALTRVFAAGGVVFVPEGLTFRLPCSAQFTSSVDISFIACTAARF